MNYKKLFINFLATIFWGVAGSVGMAQPTPEPFTSWTFDEAVEPQYWYGTSFIAEFGNFSNAVLYADGTHGSSQFATVTTTNYAQMLKNDWTGTVLGDPREEPFDGYCLGIKHPNSAGRRIVLSTPTTLYSKISLRYAVTRSNTGFKKMIFEWSTDGYTYHHIQEKPCEPLDFEIQFLNLEELTELEDQPMIYLRITVDSILSTAYQGNIKFDNLTFMGSKCMDTLVLHDTIISGENYYENGFFLQGVYGDGEYLYQRRVRFVDQCDSLYQLLLYVNDTTTPPEPPVDPEDPPTDTSHMIVPEINVHTPIIFPNPFNDQLTLDFGEQKYIGSIYVYNSIGELVEKVVPTMPGTLLLFIGKFTFHTQSWPAGIYFVHVYASDGASCVKKVVKLSDGDGRIVKHIHIID